MKKSLEKLDKMISLYNVPRNTINRNELLAMFEDLRNMMVEEKNNIVPQNNVTLRDQFAMAALNYLGDVEDVAKSAYRIADEMIKERSKK